MTTTDPFTEAARAEAERVAHENAPLEYDSIREAFVDAYAAGLRARAHLAAQEPTDAEAWENEVAAALPERYDGEEDQRDIILRAVKDMAARETQEPTDAEVEAACRAGAQLPGGHPDSWDWWSSRAQTEARRTMRAALSAARAARREEETR